jgi:glutathione S-transferase
MIDHVKMWPMTAIVRPLLYSYRRCPYAMRARMALYAAGIDFDIEEISLRDKPAQMLEVSPKGTVPVLCLPEGKVLEESLDIMHWALNVHDPHQWLEGLKNPVAQDLLARNDGDFKKALDAYKYSSRFPEMSASQMRDQAVALLINPLAEALRSGPFIGGAKPVLQDVAIFPFVRQFSGVDSNWFSEYAPASVRSWLTHWLESALFSQVMQKIT